MSKSLTVVMPFLNERDEVIATLQSLLGTSAAKDMHIIAIDDASSYPIDFSSFGEAVQVVRHVKRRGVDACRHEGICMAETPYVLLIDAHMRFNVDDWFERLLAHLEREKQGICCTTCIGLGYGVDSMAESTRRHQGATIALVSEEPVTTTDGTVKACRDVIEGKWLPEDKWPSRTEPFDIACIMGANYAFSKKWYHYLHGVDGLQMWGSSEPFLSIKSWLAGGTVKCLPDIEMGHVFRDRSPYSTAIWQLVYNKLLMMSILFPPELSGKIIAKMNQDHDFEKAYNVVGRNNEWVSDERAYFDSIRKHDIYWLTDKFRIALPD